MRDAAQLVFGTAAFGPYAGYPALSFSAIRELVFAACDADIWWFDTAPTYGAAEESLGRLIGKSSRARIATKIPPTAVTAVDVRLSLDASRRLLRRDVLDVVQLHNADALLAQASAPQIDALLDARERGVVQALGVSVYGTVAAVDALAGGFSVVQLPFNLLDQRADHDRVFACARAADAEVWARSVWARGALTGAPISQRVTKAVRRVRRTLFASEAAMPALALRFALSGPTRVLIGPRTKAELADAVTAYRAGPLPWWRQTLALQCATDDPDVYDPRRWREPSNINLWRKDQACIS